MQQVFLLSKRRLHYTRRSIVDLLSGPNTSLFGSPYLVTECRKWNCICSYLFFTASVLVLLYWIILSIRLHSMDVKFWWSLWGVQITSWKKPTYILKKWYRTISYLFFASYRTSTLGCVYPRISTNMCFLLFMHCDHNIYVVKSTNT